MTQETRPTTAQLPRRERELVTRLRHWAKANGRDTSGRTQIPLDAVRSTFQAVRPMANAVSQLTPCSNRLRKQSLNSRE
ncbi:hypothetical protein [Streptomyces adonidis]|uniref:hypothetical protein n=1 Tax=Streptomyces adonidis TaxID=3231367 RepID=UPI0034DAF5A2